MLCILLKKNLSTLLEVVPTGDVSGPGGVRTRPCRSPAADEEKVDLVPFVLNHGGKLHPRRRGPGAGLLFHHPRLGVGPGPLLGQ